MQNQLMPGQTNLQQQSGSLQPNNAALQQGGAPATSSDATTTLSQPVTDTSLTVQSAQTDPSIPSQTYLPDQSFSGVFIIVLAVIIIIGSIVTWFKLLPHTTALNDEPEAEPTPAVQTAVKPIKKPKHAKKTTRRKRTTR